MAATLQTRLFGAWACALLLTGCSSSGNSNYSEYWAALKQGLHGTFGDAPAVTKAQAAAIPYASMGYRVDGGAERLIVLATDNDGQQLWTSADHIVLLTRGGRIVRTVGLPHDLVALAAGKDGDSSPAQALRAPFASSRLEDFPDLNLYSLPITCHAAMQGRATITILDNRLDTIRVDESCVSEKLNWSFVDSFWVDPDSGLVWRSRQHIHPKGETLVTEILRPPG
jgi:hypothetical protein